MNCTIKNDIIIFREDDMDDMNCTPENEDDLEAAEMRFLQKQLELDTKNKESQEEKDYKAEFFELLDEVQLIYSEKATKFEKNIPLRFTK